MDRITSLIKPGHRVILQHQCGEPQTLVEALIEDKERLRGLEIWRLNSPNTKFKADLTEYFRFRANGAMSRIAKKPGELEVLPIDHYELVKLLDEKLLNFDVVLIQVTPPDEGGYCSLGVTADWTLESIRNARIVIAEINDQMPRTFGDCLVHQSRFDASIHTSRPLLVFKRATIGDVERAIGNFTAELVPDGATFEMGVGATTEAALDALKGKKDLGVHSGMITDATLDLVEAGAITNEKKSIDPGKIVTGCIAGSERLYRWANNNAMIYMRGVRYTHSLQVLSQIDNFIAINGAIQVDLTGQVNGEVMGNRHYGGVAGLPPFVKGAAASEGGKSIFVLPSTASGGTVSRIVPSLFAGVVTAPRSDVQYVITECGIASLRGKSLRERAEELINIAHPKFRDELRASVKSEEWRYY